MIESLSQLELSTLMASEKRGLEISVRLKFVSRSGGAGSPSHNALRINYIINRRWSRDLLVVSGVHGVEFTVS